MVTAKRFVLVVTIVNTLPGIIVSVDNDNASTKGKDFYIAFFPDVYDSYFMVDFHNSLYLAPEADSVCSISYDNGTRHDVIVNLPGNKITKVDIPEETRISAGVKVSPKGIRVKCSQESSLYGLNYYTSDGEFTAIPIEALSTHYINPGFSGNSFLGVIATSNETRVDLNIKTTCAFAYNDSTYMTGDILSVTLQEKEVFQITDTDGDSGVVCDLGGTIVSASAKVALFSGAVRQGSSHFVLQVPPLNTYSKLAIAPRVETKYAWRNVIRVIAAYDNTTIYTPTPLRHLNKGDFIDYNFTFHSDQLVISDKNVLVTQTCFFGAGGGFTIVIPGPEFYLNEYHIIGMSPYMQRENPYLTIITETKAILDVAVNGVYPDGMKWVNLTNAPYSIGVIPFQRGGELHIVNRISPIFVREYEYISSHSHGYIGGYSLNATKPNVGRAVNLKCLVSSFLLTVDVMRAGIQHSDVPYIYLGRDSCTGTLDGDIITFNVSYTDCSTKHQINGDIIHLKNTLLFSPPSPDHVIRKVQWELDVDCSKPANETKSVLLHPKYNSSNHMNVSGQIENSQVKVEVFQEASFTHTLHGTDLLNIPVGSTVYVQVSTPSDMGLVMVVNDCFAHLVADTKTVHTLIKNRCSVDISTKILATRNQITRFQFAMFDLPSDQDGFYITCNVIFCDPSDFSSKCQQTCHSDQTKIIG